MSWMKRPQGGVPPPPGPDPQAYGAPQAFGSQQNMYSNYQGGTPGNAQQQQQFWQMPPQQQPQQQQYNQQYGQVYQQDYAANANQYYQPPAQYNQGYNQTYSGVQPGYQQNSYPHQGAQPNYSQNKTHTDGWEDNWDWGWEDSSKQGQKVPGPNAASVAVPQPSQLQPQVFNNANVIEESFAPTDSWNWAMEDKKEANNTHPLPAPLPENHQAATLPVQNTPTDNNTENEVNVHSQQSPSSNSTQQPTEEIKTLNDRDVVKERLPNLALGKRFHLDNLTPQWSIESQMSQESSDGPHTHSEGTYRSENQSRNSSKSSPGLNTESFNFNYSQPGIEELYPQHNIEWSKQSTEDATLVDRVQSNNSRQESNDDLSNSLQEMSISNSENPAPDNSSANTEVESSTLQDNVGVAMHPPPSMSPANFPPPAPLNQPPAQTASAHAVGGVAQASGLLPPPASSSSSLPPPSSFPPPMSSQNPYKHAGPFSHKTVSKVSSGNPSPMQPYPPQPNLTSPVVVNKVSQQNRGTLGFGANLETTPDNSERPDQPQVAPFRPTPVAPQVPDNLEVAPRNDRNEYLQTAHLSGADYGENTDFSRNAPPPGLRRMVVGQQESEYSQNINLTSDEPPPGLARMVPGQQTESESTYNQPNDNYMDRHIDGGPIDGAGRPYRQAEGQQTSDNYTQPPTARGNERRPIGLDRMVPGEPSNDDYSQYQGAPFAGSNEQRVVTGLDREYSISAEPSPSDVREQNMDGSDYTEQTVRNPSRSVIGARESSADASPDYGARPDEQQREVVMEGENLQDLSVISSTELSFSREPTFEGADVPAAESSDRKADAPESLEHSMSGSRRQSLNHANTSGDDSERDRLLKSSPRREKHKPSRDRDKEGRYSRGDRKYEREPERRAGRDERRSERRERERERDREREREASPEAREARRARRTRERDDSPDSRRTRRSTRSHRYEPEDTDYYSDTERYQRRQREGSYTSKPPRHEGERRQRDERERRPAGDRHRDRYEQRYRDIDPSRKYGNLRKERDDDRKRVVTFSSDAKSSDSSRKEGETYSPSRAESREPTGTDDERDPRRRDRRSRHKRTDPYYDAYGGAGAGAGGAGLAGAYAGDAYALQRQQYEYYERLRVADPAAYMQLYKLMAAQPHDYMAHLYGEGYVGAGAGYESAGREGREERGSVHSGRSSAAGLKGHDTYYGCRADAPASLLDAPSLRTDISDRDLNTDASLNLHLEESTVRSERMTPFRYSTAHIKGSISSRHLVVVAAAYPVDGRPARVTLRSLHAALAHAPHAHALRDYPGPLVKGVTHKKSVIEYCMSRVRSAGACARDRVGRALVWELLALLLRQNGVVVGTDIAELLMKNAREYEYSNPADKAARPDSRRESSLSGGREEEPLEMPDPNVTILSEQPRTDSASPRAGLDEAAALDKFREYLIYGNRQEALEFAMSARLWGHALLLAWHGERRARAQAAQRFVAALAPRDPLRSLYAALAAKLPPAATCVSDESWGDWRPHAAIILSNTSAKPDQDRRTLIQLGDTLAARGLPFCAQFCYISGGVQWAAHPLAPMRPPASADAPASPASPAPRLTLLLADPRAQTFNQHATDEAIFATEIYEYALSLNQDYYIKELQVYKLVLATRLVDVGLYERALAYTECAARCVTRAPRDHAPALVRALAALADRLRYHDPVLQEDPPLVEEGAESGEPSPRHQQWLDDVTSVADALTAEASAQNTPHHAPAQADYYAQGQGQYAWHDQAQQQYQQPAQAYPEPAEESSEYPQYYQPDYSQPPAPPASEAAHAPVPAPGSSPAPAPAPAYGYGYDENNYWQPQDQYGYGESGAGAGAGAEAEAAPEPRPMITMPGASANTSALYAGYDDDRPPSQDTDRETDTPKPGGKGGAKGSDESKEDRAEARRGGWLGGFLTRLSLRPPNQMILPDDKNPTIVWDAEHKRWRNLDAGDDERAAPPPPPPSAHAHAHAQAAAPPAGAPPAAPTSNIFKMQKGRHIKKSYVDVFNPSGAATRPLPPAADVLGPPPPAAPSTPSYFVPQPTHQSGFYDPTQMAAGDDDIYKSGI